MIKKIVILSCAIVLCNALQAQETRAVPKEKNSLNVYYGYNLLGSVFNGLPNTVAGGLTYSSLGSIGAVYEHLFSNVIGAGLEASCSTFSLSYGYSYTVFDPNTNTTTLNMLREQANFTTIRAMLRLNIHFIKHEKFDCYVLTSLGGRKTWYTYTVTQPNYTNSYSRDLPVFFGIKPGLGARYFFGAFGVHAEVAAGTPIVCGGVSCRF